MSKHRHPDYDAVFVGDSVEQKERSDFINEYIKRSIKFSRHGGPYVIQNPYGWDGAAAHESDMFQIWTNVE